MITPTGAQQQYRSTGKRYRLILAPEGWGKTYMLAYDALWYSRFSNKQILVITPKVDEFNQALSQYPLVEHDSSEIIVCNEYKPGNWFMTIIDCAETYTEVQIKNLIKQAADSKFLWISSQTPAKEHWLYQLMLSKKKQRTTGKTKEWWLVLGDKHESYTELAGNTRTIEETFY